MAQARDPHLSEYLSYVDYGASDRELLAELRPLLEKQADSLVASFYRHLLSFPATRDLLRDPEVKARLLSKQREYLLSLGGPVVDDAYVAERRRIGEVHERIGLEPRWYLGAYALYLSLLTPLICEHCQEVARAERTVVALNKILLLDAQLAMESYIARRERDLEYLNRELAQTGRRLSQDYEAQGALLRRAAERAQAAERLASIGTLVAGLAHEIGTPMGVIQGHAKLLESAVQGKDAEWRLKTIQEQIERISRIMRTLLKMARPSRGRRMPVVLEPLMESTLAFLSEKFQRRGVRVVREFDSVPSVQADPERLQQLLLNLFMNACDAMPDGGELCLGLARTEDGDIEVRVADTGVGIPEEHVPRIFEPFFTSKPAGEGNGLGLVVAEGIAADHGGGLFVESVEGQGTTFRIVLPAARPLPA